MNIRYGALALAVAAGLSMQAIVGSKADAATGKMPKPSHPSSAQPHFRFPARIRAKTDSVLYDQSGIAEDGAPAQDFQSSFDSFDAAGADDFVVSDAAGWTVSGFNFQVGFFTTSASMPPPADTTYDITVYDDANGQPGSVACTYSALDGTLDASDTNLSVSLPTPCALGQGLYWLSMQAVFDFPPEAFWSNASGAPLGSEAMWRESGGFATGCTAWAHVSTCSGVGGGNPNFLFQVVGSVGSAMSCTPNGICLVATVGSDLTPDACAATDAIDATVGDQLNFCYTVTNSTSVTLDYETLQDNVDGEVFRYRVFDLPAGGSTQFNRIATVGATNTYTATWTAQDVPPGYTAAIETGGGCADRIFADGFDDPIACAGGGFIDITATGTPLGLADDEQVAKSMPFSFDFYGTTSNSLCIDNNGIVLFGVAACPGVFLAYNASLPASSLPMPAIMPLWDDFTDTTGDVYTDLRGAAPNRQFIVEWFDRLHYGTSNVDGATFEVIFNEDGTLQFEYADVDYTGMNALGDPPDCSMGACATIGVQADSSLFMQFSAFEQSVSNDSGIQWTATASQVFASTDSVTVNVGAPQIVVNPDTITGSVDANGTAVLPFAIENHGNRDLDWTIEEASTAAHLPPVWDHRYVAPAPFAAERAAVMTKAAPHVERGKAVKHARLSLAAVPAFVMDHDVNGGSDSFGTLDAAAPESFGAIAPAPVALYKTGTFVDNDFAKEYVASIDTNEIATLDTTTGGLTVLPSSSPPMVAGEIWVGLKWDATTDTLFGAGCDGSGTGCHLYTIDATTGAVTQGPAVTNIDSGSGAFLIDIAIDPSGLMYGVEYYSGALVAIDKTTGEGGVIGSTGIAPAFVQSLDFDASAGTLYWTSYALDANGTDFAGVMYTINTATGAVSFVGPLVNADEEYAFAIAVPSGPCSQPTDLPWLTLSPLAGTTAGGDSTPMLASIDATGHAAGEELDGTVCVHSNDPAKRLVMAPISVTVTAPPPPLPPEVNDHFAPDAVAANVSSNLIITLSNPAGSQATLTGTFTDALPVGLVIANANAVTTCAGGTLTADVGTGSITLAAGATIPAGGSCTISADVVASIPGDYTNTIPDGALQTNQGSSAFTSDQTLTVLQPPMLTKGFIPSTVAPGVPSTLTLTLTNPNAGFDAPLVSPLLDAFPAGLTIAASPNASTDCGGTLTATPGSDSVTLDSNGSSIAAGATCSVSVAVVATVVNDYPNSIPVGALDTVAGSNQTSADATLRVADPPTVVIDFNPTNVAVNTPSTMTITLSNSNGFTAALTGPLVDGLPPGLVVAGTPNAATTCGGNLVGVVAGATSVKLDPVGSSIPAVGSCTVTVDVESATASIYANDIPAGALQTNLGNNAAPGDASLTVTP